MRKEKCSVSNWLIDVNGMSTCLGVFSCILFSILLIDKTQRKNNLPLIEKEKLWTPLILLAMG